MRECIFCISANLRFVFPGWRVFRSLFLTPLQLGKTNRRFAEVQRMQWRLPCKDKRFERSLGEVQKCKTEQVQVILWKDRTNRWSIHSTQGYRQTLDNNFCLAKEGKMGHSPMIRTEYIGFSELISRGPTLLREVTIFCLALQKWTGEENRTGN